MQATESVREILDRVLTQWKSGVDAHDPRRVAELFTVDAIFQGLRPYGVGPQAVFDYYDSQPPGMTVDYRIVESRRMTDDVVVGYVDATFAFRDRDALHLVVGVFVTRTGEGWRIAYYQAGPVPDPLPSVRP